MGFIASVQGLLERCRRALSRRKGSKDLVRKIPDSSLLNSPALEALGLSTNVIRLAAEYVYEVLDSIDEKLVGSGSERLSELVELANLSAIVGNLFRGGIVRHSSGSFASNAPHTYPDILGCGEGCSDVEIKVALEGNNPKGHLVKPGPHLILRYVLGSMDGGYVQGKENRGGVVWIWEVRAGRLEEGHFNFSNTEGDSGKTAVINAQGLRALDVVICDLDRYPKSRGGRNYEELARLVERGGLFD